MSDHAGPSILPAEMRSASLRGYIFGFAGSIVLTVAAYLLVVGHASTNGVLVSALVLLALVQFGLQLVFFLHLNMTTQQKWRLYMLGAMVIVVLVIVIGSLWIVGNLNTRMTPAQEQQYMTAKGGL